MNKAAIAILIPIVVMVVASDGCSTINLPAYLAPAPTQPGVFEFEVGNSVYPLSRGAFKGFQRYLNSGEQVRGYLEWKESYAIHYKWSLTVYAPDDSPVLNWDGTDLKYNFSFVAVVDGIYKIEIVKRDSPSRGARLTIDPPDWSKWGKG
ncbi:MAG: hypothetical protein V1932_06120 [Chloroflexota bacterium]